MNHRLVCPSLCLLLALLSLTGCLLREQPLIPFTDTQDASIAALTELVRNNVLDYVISSARVANAPPGAEWKLDDGRQLNGEYRFRSGDWTMLVWPADVHEGNQRVVIINKVENVAWCGYVKPDNHVVDTAYYR
jgi:hypothetical protein